MKKMKIKEIKQNTNLKIKIIKNKKKTLRKITFTLKLL